MVADHVAEVAAGIHLLASTKVMVGVPADKSERKNGTINNAALAFIHDKGAPEANIPPRPFMVPGIEKVQDKIVEGLVEAGKIALDGKPAGVERQFIRVGMVARDSIKERINSNIPPPLALSTVLGRIRRRKGLKYRADKRQAVDKN